MKDYLLLGVKPEEFAELKKQEKDLVNLVTGEFNESWKSKVKGIKVTFKYNPSRNAIGIYVERDEKQQLVVERKDLSGTENAIVYSLYSTLEERLYKLRLPKEEWIDSVS